MGPLDLAPPLVTINVVADQTVITEGGFTRGPQGEPGEPGADGASTAAEVALAPIDGLDSANVQDAIEALHAAVVDVSPGLDGLPAGSIVTVYWTGSAWQYAGSSITARPTSRTDITVDFIDPVGGATPPAWANVGDLFDQVSP